MSAQVSILVKNDNKVVPVFNTSISDFSERQSQFWQIGLAFILGFRACYPRYYLTICTREIVTHLRKSATNY